MPELTIPDALPYCEALVAGNVVTSEGWMIPTTQRVLDIMCEYIDDAHKFIDDKAFFDLRTLDAIIDALEYHNINVIYTHFN